MLKKPELFILGIDGGVTSYILDEIAKGNLPNFKRVIDQGCLLSDCQPAFPSISATCWSTIQTGASPQVHKVTDENILLPGSYINEFVSSYHGDNLKAERFWEAAARINKKSLIADFCVSGPAKSDLVYQIGGIGSVAAEKALKDKPVNYTQKEISEQIYMFEADILSVFPELPKDKMTSSGKWQPQIALKQSSYEKLDNRYWKLNIEKKNEAENPNNIEPFYWIMEHLDNGINIAFNEEDMKKGNSFFIPMGGWSDVIKRTLTDDTGEGIYRFRIKTMPINEQGAFFVFITPSVNILNALSPLDFAKRVNEIEEIPSSNCYGHFLLKQGKIDTAFECSEFKINWFKKIILDTMEHDPVDIMAMVLGYPDSVNHVYRSVYENVASATQEEKDVATYAYKRAYELADEFIGWLFDNAIGEDTVFMLLSDHGAVGFNRTILVHDYLEAEGFITYIPEPDGKHVHWRNRRIDWSKTKAYPMGSSSIYINLKGREPEGIVEPKDYKKTVNEIIKILQKYHWTENDECYLAFAVERAQAGFVGLGEELTGDVVYGLCGSTTGGYIGGVHACQIPSAKTETGDIRCLCVVAGKNIKSGMVIDRPTKLEDIAPTLCYLLKYPQPAQATGGIIFQLFEDDLY